MRQRIRGGQHGTSCLHFAWPCSDGKSVAFGWRLLLLAAFTAHLLLLSATAHAQTWTKYRCVKNGNEAVCVNAQRRETIHVLGASVNVTETGQFLESHRVAYEEQAKPLAYANLAGPRSSWAWCSDIGWKLFGPTIRTESTYPAPSTAVTEERIWLFEYMGAVTQNTCVGAQPTVRNSDSVSSLHTYAPNCPEPQTAWNYDGPPDARTGLGVCFQYCPPNWAWSAAAQACKPRIWIPRSDDPPDACWRVGNPIHPLRGVKREIVDLGVKLGATSLTFTYDSTPLVPKTGTNPAPGEGTQIRDAGALGPMWSANLFKRIATTSVSASVNPGAARVSRGDGTTVTMSRSSSGQYAAEANTADRLVSIAGGGLRYYDSKATIQETYDSTGLLTGLSWANGQTVTLSYSNASTPSSIAPGVGYLIQAGDNSGRVVSFTYTARSAPLTGAQLSTITDAAGQSITLSYAASGNLGSINWPDGKSKIFLYENGPNGALTGVTDELNQRYATFGYDADGRATSTEYAGGVTRYSASYSTPPSIVVSEQYDSAADALFLYSDWVAPQGTTVTEPNGQSSSWGASSLLNKNYLTSQSQPAGSGCAASNSALSFDASGNVASADDFNGGRTCSAYDLSRNLETTRVEGLANTQSCGAVTATGATLPTGSRKVSTVWHPDWRLETKRAEPGKVTTSVYNGQPDPFNGYAPATCAPATALLPDGKPIAVLCKQVEQATTDTNGSRGTDVAGTPGVTADPNYGNVVLLLHMDDAVAGTFTDSSGLGKVPLTVATPLATDPANARYGAASGNFTGGYLVYPDSPDFDMGSGDFTIETWIKFNSASMGSRVLVFGKNSSNGGNGTVVLGNWGDNKLAFSWTTTGGSSSITDTALISPNIWYHVAMVRSGGTMTLWKNGVAVGSAPVSGAFIPNANHFGVGVLGDYIGSYGGSGTRMMGWLDESPITKGIARYTGAFPRPSGMFGATTTIPGSPSYMDTSAANRVRQWTYNASGQVLTAKDPLNNTTSFTYYSDTTADHTLGDLQSVTNAKSQVTNYTKYNKHGQLLESTDPNGVVTINTYDLRQRLLSTSVGGQTTSYEYDAAGQLLKVTSPDTSWIGYEYDAAHRQVAVKDNLGNRIEYVLDNAGNKTAQSVKDPGGNLARSLARSIDALGRVQQTTGRE